ncbi:MAG: energy-coupling factor ABC transporter ATP-binding protein [Bryobacteraceae bacterium]
MNPAVEIEGLSFGFQPSEYVLRDLSLRIYPGERVALVGANGAGKSTLLWCIAGLHRAKGRVRLFGLTPAAARERVGMVFQNPEDQLFMPTVLEDVALPLINRGMQREQAFEKARTALAAMGLEGQAGRPARHMSLGERKRAAVAAALALSPQLLLMDEPTAELDRRAARLLREHLAKLELTMVVAGHDLEFLARVTQRAVILAGGKVLADGPSVELLADEVLLERAGLV